MVEAVHVEGDGEQVLQIEGVDGESRIHEVVLAEDRDPVVFLGVALALVAPLVDLGARVQQESEVLDPLHRHRRVALDEKNELIRVGLEEVCIRLPTWLSKALQPNTAP